MAKLITLEVVTPEKAVVNDEARIIVAPGILGEFGALPGHTPYLTPLKVGRILYRDASGKERLLFVNQGFAETTPDKVTILAESAEFGDDIDVARAKAARERAEKRLAEKKKDLDYVRVKAALDRAVQRLKVAGG